LNRWIRYEEDFDVEMQRWHGLEFDFNYLFMTFVFLAPRVGCLNFHSLLELRRGLQYGVIDKI
jgi:hypothetical protein